MINSLVICTVLYILIALVLTGMVSYKELNVVDPLAEVFQKTGQGWIAYIISISAVIATTSVLLVFQLGQPRIWMSMSRDGLLPKAFSRIHHKYKTPSFSTIVTGLLVAIPTLFTPSSLMVDLTSIGTLFAFILVSGGVLMLPRLDSSVRTGFKLPYIDGRLIVPLLYLLFVYLFRQRLVEDFRNMGTDNLQEILFIVFIAEGAILSALTIARRYSLIPILGVLFCSYLLIEIPAKSWLWFLGWMAGGLCIYFFYGYRNSKLKVKS